MTYVHFLGLKLYFLKKDRFFCCLFVTDGICSEVLQKRCLPRNDGVKIQQHMRFSRGVSYAILAKSQTGCKIRSISSSSVQISGVMQKKKLLWCAEICRSWTTTGQLSKKHENVCEQNTPILVWCVLWTVDRLHRHMDSCFACFLPQKENPLYDVTIS